MKIRIATLIAAIAVLPLVGSAADAKPIALTKDNFEAKAGQGVVLVDFWAEWCAPCKLIAPTIDELAKAYQGRAVIAKVDVDSNPELSKRFGIRSIPNLKILKDGKVVDEIVGFVPKEDIVRKLDKHLK
jgi:thioredoxin 1